MSSTLAFILVVVQLTYPDAHRATIYYPQAFHGAYVVAVPTSPQASCARIDVFTFECWGDLGGSIEIRASLPCGMAELQLGISQQSRTLGQVWQDVQVANPDYCAPTAKPTPHMIYFPFVPAGVPALE